MGEGDGVSEGEGMGEGVVGEGGCGCRYILI